MSKINHMKKLRNTAFWMEDKEDALRNIADAMMDMAAEDRRNAMRFYEIAQSATQTADRLAEEVSRLHQEVVDTSSLEARLEEAGQ